MAQKAGRSRARAAQLPTRAVPSKLTPYHARLELALKADALRSKQNRRPSKALFLQIKADGYTGSHSRAPTLPMRGTAAQARSPMLATLTDHHRTNIVTAHAPTTLTISIAYVGGGSSVEQGLSAAALAWPSLMSPEPQMNSIHWLPLTAMSHKNC